MYNKTTKTLRIAVSQPTIDYLIDMSLAFMFCVISTFGQSDSLLYYAAFIFMIGFTAFKLLSEFVKTKKIFIPMNIIWFLSFVLLAIFSSVWSIAPDRIFSTISKMIQILLINFCIVSRIKTVKDFERVLDLLIFSYVFMTVFILINTEPSRWFSGGVGGDVTSYNTNVLGMMASFGVALSFYKFVFVRKKFYLITAAITLIFVIMTSSRKSLLISAVAIVLIMMFRVRRGYLIKVCVAFAAVALLIYATQENEFLYKAIGKRLYEMFLHLFTDEGLVDGSLSLRQYFVFVALEAFKESPILGMGFNTFGNYLIGYLGYFAYAHNNYMETLSGLGLVGMIMYYWFYVYLLIKSFQNASKGLRLSSLALILIILLLFFETGMVTFYDRSAQLMLTLIFCAVSIDDSYLREEIRSEYPESRSRAA